MQNKTRIVVMGCGGSGGVPYAGNVWGNCDPQQIKNHRLRPSLFVQKGETNIVIDTGPDFRQQINRVNIEGLLTAILYTHAHNDHIIGIDDIRAFFIRAGKEAIPIYAGEEALNDITRVFNYIFSELNPLYPPTAKAHLLPEVLKIGDLEFSSFNQIHGRIMTKGFRIGDFAYCTDVNDLPAESLEKLKGIKTWIVGCYPSDEGQPNHAGFNKINEWIDILKPEMTYLTHLTASADYDTLCQTLPPHIRPAYDGMELFI